MNSISTRLRCIALASLAMLWLPAAALAQGSWTILAPMLMAHANGSGAAVNGMLYVISGFSPGPTTFSEVYDPSTNTWTAVTPIPMPRVSSAGGAIGGKLYLAGGCFDTICDGPFSRLDIYDPATGTWQEGPAMPIAAGGPGGSVIDGKLYVVGGIQGSVMPMASVMLSTLQIFDPATNSWTLGAPMPTPRAFVSTAVVDGKLYALGGTDPNNQWNVVEAYDPLTNSWTTKAPLPGPRSHAGAGIIDGRIHVVGGMGLLGATVSPPHAVYDPATDSWSADEPMPLGSRFNVTDVINNALYIAGVNSVWSPDVLQAFNKPANPCANDTAPPLIQSVTADPSVLWPPNNRMRPVVISVQATDNCTAQPVCQIVNVASNEPQGHERDWQITGALTLNLRAQRLGGEHGRRYTIAVRCTDAAGNAATKATVVTVPHDLGRDHHD